MSQQDQDNTCQNTGAVDAHIFQARSPVRDEQLNGFIDTGSQRAAAKGSGFVFSQHPGTPAEQRAQSCKFREMGNLPQKTAGRGLGGSLSKEGFQKGLDPVAESTGHLTGKQRIAPDEGKYTQQQCPVQPQTPA